MSERGHVDVGRLHVITDESPESRFTHVELARLAVQGGADTIRLRAAQVRPTRDVAAAARRLKPVVARRGARLVIQERVDAALAAGVDAVHLGGRNLEIPLARQVLGDAAVIGRSVSNLREAKAAAALPADYLAVGPELELDDLRRIVDAVDLPVVAVAGMRPQQVAALLAAGAHGIALLASELSKAEPRSVVARFRESIEIFACVRA